VLYPDVEFHVVRWPVNKEAPFQFNLNSVSVYERGDYTNQALLELAKGVAPDIIITSGWIDKGYVNVCQHYKGKIKTVLALDNHWLGGVKQKIAALLSPFVVKNKFSHVWVPGKPQRQFAEKLGYKSSEIAEGFYSADVDLFSSYFEKAKESKVSNFPKRFLYVGRYIHRKGIFDMWNSFIELQNEQPNDWELWCIGTGDEFDNKIEHDKIKHFGFVQPSEMEYYIKNTGVFILPSHFEPWGVVAHEFAAAGFPLILSDKIGAGIKFLDNGCNGFVFPAGNKEAIKDAFRKLIDSSENELLNMQKKSIELSLLITPEKWANTLMKLVND
jgi:glycosyltransferase involved in cell wall biosynthesis